ncbi:MAG TPA: molybdopterin-binding protein [Ktedonobacterales bacterium]
MIEVEVVAAGNELLIGDVVDTNSNWLCKRITGIGGAVKRVALVRDEAPAIADEVRGALERGAHVIFTVGGLGPTDDDLTLQAVALATQRGLELNADAQGMVKRKYEELARSGAVQSAEMTPSRLKMAHLPQGAQALVNSVGGAPGVLVRMNHSAIVSLPGVPAELQGIFEGSLQPFLNATFGAGYFLERVAVVDCNDESTLAPILSDVVARHPEVYIKSRARKFGADITFRVTVSQSGHSREDVESAVSAALLDLEQALGGQGIAIDTSI